MLRPGMSIADGHAVRFTIRRSRKRPRQDAMVAVACDSFVNRYQTYTGTVLYRGEYWSARSAAPVFADQQVVVTSRQGLLLQVVAQNPVSTGVYR